MVLLFDSAVRSLKSEECCCTRMGEKGATEKQQQMQQWSLVGFKAPYYHYVELPRESKVEIKEEKGGKKKVQKAQKEGREGGANTKK